MYGKLLTKPDAESSASERGRYALLLMFMVGPWRGVDRVDFVERVAFAGDEAAVWEKLYAEYQTWRRSEVDEIAASFSCRSGAFPGAPEFGTFGVVGMHDLGEASKLWIWC